MDDYKTVVTEHLRITILRLLEEHPAGRMNESVIADAVEHFGFSPSHDRIRTELSWLAEQQLLKLHGADFDCMVAELTQRGEDVAKCRVMVPGVKRPSRR